MTRDERMGRQPDGKGLAVQKGRGTYWLKDGVPGSGYLSRPGISLGFVIFELRAIFYFLFSPAIFIYPPALWDG
jgi:hypothetical protein